MSIYPGESDEQLGLQAISLLYVIVKHSQFLNNNVRKFFPQANSSAWAEIKKSCLLLSPGLV